MTVAQFLEEHNFGYKPRGDQFIVDECPACGESWHCYIHQDTGLWDCKKCGESGNLWTLRRLLGDVDKVSSVTELLAAESTGENVSEDTIEGYCAALREDTVTLSWLLNRGITRKSMTRFRLGLLNDSMKTWLTIPYYLNGVAVNVKFRALPPREKEFRLISGNLTPLFNVDQLDPKKPANVCEGELDAIVLIQEGEENTVSVPLGADNFAPDHFDALVCCGRINLVYDNDEAGRRGSDEVAKRLGPERCFIVKLPVNDVTDFFQKFKYPDFVAIVEEAVPAGNPVVVSIDQAFKSLAQQRASKSETAGIHLPWRNVDRIVGELQPGWLVILQATPKQGKTTLCLNFLLDMARQKSPALMYCLEMSPEQLLERIVSNVRNVSPRELDGSDIIMARAELHGVPLYFGSARAGLTARSVFETILYAVKRFGIKVIVFDHLHFLCRSIDRVTSETGRVVRDFKLLFVDLGIPGIVITHPPKLGANVIPGIYGSRDSGEITGDADVVVSLFRRQIARDAISEDDFRDTETPTFETRTLVRVAASRFVGGGSAVLYFNESAMRFEELSGDGA